MAQHSRYNACPLKHQLDECDYFQQSWVIVGNVNVGNLEQLVAAFGHDVNTILTNEK